MKNDDKPVRIRYDEGCLGAHALNLIGDRWALLVVRELIYAPKRFQMLRAGLPGISASVLNGRLTQLQEAGVVIHDRRMGIYSLAPAGQRLLGVLQSLCQWALTVPGHDPTRFISPSALMISMGVTLRRDRVARQHLAGFDFGTEAFEMRVDQTGPTTAAVEHPDAAFVVSGTGNDVAAAVYGSRPLSELAASGRIGIAGNAAAAQEFVDLFSLDAAPRG